AQSVAAFGLSSPSALYCCADRRDLPPFPTRRSSDLERPPRRSQVSSGRPRRWHMPRRSAAPWEATTSCPSRGSSSSPPTAPRSRSEEHTSELQSRENLVCRLRLQKKNEHDRRVHLHE